MKKCSPVGRRVGHTGVSPRGIRGLIMGIDVIQGLHCLSRHHASLSTALRGPSERLLCCHSIRFYIVCMQGIHFITKEYISLDLPVLSFTRSPKNNLLQNGDYSIRVSAQCRLRANGLQGWADAGGGGVRSELVTKAAPVCVPHGAHTGTFGWGYGCQRDTFHATTPGPFQRFVSCL